MAVSTHTVAFDDFHFQPEAFDALMRANGTRALIQIATRCGCFSEKTGNRDPACRLCYPLGFLHDAPVEAWIHAPSRRVVKQVTPEGGIDTGDAAYTLPSDIKATDGTRILIPDAIERTYDVLTKGKEDVIRFARVVAVESGHRIVRNPPTGHPYDNELVPLETDVDFTVEDNRTIVWPSGSPVPNGARYVVRLQVQSEYVVWGEPRTRVENGKQLPSVYPVKRLDFFVHPKGERPLSF